MECKKWEPITKIVMPLRLVQLLDNNSGLNIILQEKNGTRNNIIINFDGIVLSYRVTKNETQDNRLTYLEKIYGDKLSNWPFYKSNSSEYLNWLEKRSCGIHGGFTIKHYIAITNDYLIDILSSYAPTVKIIKES